MLYADWLHGSEDLSMARAVRHKVFVEEQNIPEEIEYDEQDGMAWHLLVLDEDTPIGTGRVYIDNGQYHIGRVCVLPEHREIGIGNAIVRFLLERALNAGAPAIYLSAQTYIKNMYTKFGFEQVGDAYEIAGHEHVNMMAAAENVVLSSSCGGSCSGCSGCSGGCSC
ncbi:MAG: GNAT family N-acetyltransferase [Clostridia bacterium]|nr:GNAT family N-acetyltransferase [Clostridia bacterium]